MSMAGMLGKMLVAGLVAKGVGKMMGGGNTSGGGIAGALGGLLGGKSGGGGGLGGLLGGGGSGGGIGGLLGGLLGGGGSGSANAEGGGLGSLLGAGASGGGIGGLLNSLSGDGASQQSGGIGDILGSFIGNTQSAQQPEPTDEQNQQAEILLRAMINAAKSDGEIDKSEQEKIVEHLGDVSDEEAQFVRNEMSSQLDVDTFIRSVPRGMEQQVYLMSLTAIDLDSQAEAQYLDKLAKGLGISEQASNSIHQQLGVPQLYS